MKVILSSDDDTTSDDDDGDPPATKNLRKETATNNTTASSDVSAVPTAMFKSFSEGVPIATDPPLVAHHRALFMQRAFPSANNNDSSDVHTRDNRESSLRNEDDLDYICYVLKHWGGNANLKEMDDDLRRRQLAHFRRENPVGKHHVGKYHYDEITLPNGEKRNILRRIEKEKVGRIVVSRERIFDAINEWHRGGSGHFGSERTWKDVWIRARLR